MLRRPKTIEQRRAQTRAARAAAAARFESTEDRSAYFRALSQKALLARGSKAQKVKDTREKLGALVKALDEIDYLACAYDDPEHLAILHRVLDARRALGSLAKLLRLAKLLSSVW